MYIYLKKKSKNQHYVTLKKCVRRDEKNYSEQVKNYGVLEELPDEIQAVINDDKKRKQLAKLLEADLNLELGSKLLEQLNLSTTQPLAHQPLIDVIDRSQDQETHDEATDLYHSDNKCENFNKVPVLKYGHLPIKYIWERVLRIDYKIDRLQEKENYVTDYSINNLLFYLTISKILEPASYYATHTEKSNYFWCPWEINKLSAFYSSLDFMCRNKDEIFKQAVKRYQAKFKTSIEYIFFDCTNFYFETPYDDETWLVIRLERKKAIEMAINGYSFEQIEEYLSSQDFIDYLASEIEEREEEIIRMLGKSKEMRFTQPIVTLALAIDQNGFPLDCLVVAGNIHEGKTLKPIVESIKSKYLVKNVYFVADKGLNSIENLYELSEQGLGYVVAHKVMRQNKNFINDILDHNGYVNYEVKHGKLVRAENQTIDDSKFRIKASTIKKSKIIKDKSDNKTKLTVDANILFIFNPTNKAKDLKEINEAVAKAQEAIAKGVKMGNPNGSGWRAYVKTQKEAAQNKNDKDLYKAVGLKEEVIEQHKQLAGYSAIIYDHPKDLKNYIASENESLQFVSPQEIFLTYHKLTDIEHCFRILKSNFSIRPVYVRTPNHITGHCYLCVLALMLLKVIELLLNEQGEEFHLERIIRGLNDAKVLMIPGKSIPDTVFINMKEHGDEYSISAVNKGKTKNSSNLDIEVDDFWDNYLERMKAHADDIDTVLSAVGLKPLQLYSSMGEIKERLGLRNHKNDVMIPEIKRRILGETFSNI